MGSACLLGQNIRQLRAQGGHALGRAEAIALHHIQNRLQRGFRVAPEVRLVALVVDVIHAAVKADADTKARCYSGARKAIVIDVAAELISCGIAADDDAL